MASTMKANEAIGISVNRQNELSDESSDEEVVQIPSNPRVIDCDPAMRKNWMLAPSNMTDWQCCYIDRVRVGLTKLDRKYAMYGNDGMFYAVCEKRKKTKTPYYVISTDPDSYLVDREDAFFVGKLRSNFLGSEFTGYDHGRNPKKITKSTSSLAMYGAEVPLRTELVHISYPNNLTSFKKKGDKIKVVIPKPFVPCRPLLHDSQGLRALSKERLGEEVVTSFVNRPGRWSPADKCYRINWVHSRAPMLSRRNFQLVRSDDRDEVVLQFGKGQGDRYFLDFRAGITPFQALSIVASMMDYKVCTA